MIAMDHFTSEGFRRLLALHHLRPDRPGDLSARDRRSSNSQPLEKDRHEIASVLRFPANGCTPTCRMPARNSAPATRLIRWWKPALRSDQHYMNWLRPGTDATNLIDCGGAGLLPGVPANAIGRALDLAHAETGRGEIIEHAHDAAAATAWIGGESLRRLPQRIDQFAYLVEAPSRRRNPR